MIIDCLIINVIRGSNTSTNCTVTVNINNVAVVNRTYNATVYQEMLCHSAVIDSGFGLVQGSVIGGTSNYTSPPRVQNYKVNSISLTYGSNASVYTFYVTFAYRQL